MNPFALEVGQTRPTYDSIDRNYSLHVQNGEVGDS
jgi:hypothetical protein